MTRAGILLFLLLAASPSGICADAPAAPPPPAPPQATPTPASAPATAPATAPLAQQISAGLPKFDPTAPVAVNPAPVGKPDADTLVLPKMKVAPRPRLHLTPQIVLTDKALAEQSDSALGNALNKHTLPLFGTSAAERILDEKERAKNEKMRNDVLALAKAAEVTDPAQAQVLRDAVNRP